MIGAMPSNKAPVMLWWEWVVVGAMAITALFWSPTLRGSESAPLLVVFMLVMLGGPLVAAVGWAASPRPRKRWAMTVTAYVGIRILDFMPKATPRQYFWLVMALAAVTVLLKAVERQNFEVAHQALLLREARDEALRLKLAPHFLFNALNTVKAQIATDPQGAASTADRLAALLRQVLDGSGRLTVPLREELSFVESYLGIERIRFGDRLRVQVEIPDAAEAMEIPPLSLQALVENAVKHGIAPREEGGEIRIWARVDQYGARRTLHVGVDNPLAEGAEPGTGVGLEALRARLRAPTDLQIEQRKGRFLAQFAWYVDGVPARA